MMGMTPSDSRATGPWPSSGELRRSLPRQVRFISAESTGSYVRRLAYANGLEPIAVLDLVGRGQKALPDPASTELYLNAAALARLSVLVGCSAARLQQVLPTVRASRLLQTHSKAPAWRWLPRREFQQYVVAACHLCAAAKGARQEAYVWSDTAWHVCVRHGLWLDDQSAGEAAWSLPGECLQPVVQAHRERIRFERSSGPMGRALFADAYSACAHWWNEPRLTLPIWRERQQPFPHVDYSSPFPALLVIYPEVVKLAKMFARHERHRQRGTLDLPAWREQLRKVFRVWGSPLEIEEVAQPIALWTSRHRPTPRSGRLYAHSKDDLEGPLEHLTCLPFTYGRGVRGKRNASKNSLQLRPFIGDYGVPGWEMLPLPGLPGSLDPRTLR
ncbi:TniQ family protein [Streptomyces angustmyceticus]|uniref:TniQ family protein n=2 Tax=Streptomyces angustmyceticus TaxID=285578 RepID=UPI00369B3EFE